jgi:DHA2 family multidrug resistance protein
MISMLIVGRLVRAVDPRKLVVLGLALTALSLWEMSGFTPQMDMIPVIRSGVVQGLGLGLVFVPLSTVAFATIDTRYRADATALFSLVRNIGSSVGISLVTVLLTHNIQVNHAELSALISPFNPVLRQASPLAAAGQVAALQQMDLLVNAQAAMIGYVDDFVLMMWVTLLAMPLALMLRRPAPYKVA